MAYEKVVRLYVSVNETLVVQRLHSLNALDHYHAYRLDWVLSATEIKQFLQVGPEDIHDHDVKVALDSIVVDLWESDFQKLSHFDSYLHR